MRRTWTARDLAPPWRIVDLELTEPIPSLQFGEDRGVYLLLRHHGRPAGRLLLGRSVFGDDVAADHLAGLVRDAGSLGPAHAMRDALEGEIGAAPLPPLTVAVCTRNRAATLRRTLEALVAMRNGRTGDDPPLDILVVDNAPPDGATRAAAETFAGVRYVVEPVPGLDFGRNRALAETDRDYLGFIDDDALPDGGWLDGFAESLRERPDAGAFTGPVLPLVLDTEARIRFEAAGGFGEGIDWQTYGVGRWEDGYYPASFGRLGTGANMIFRTAILRDIGGFDDALDTGPPLPGGGDVDMFYRVVRSGAPLVYAPRQAILHEHRQDMPGLKRQFRSWGLSIGAVMRKNARTDPETVPAHRRVLWWLVVQRFGRTLAGYPLGRAPVPPSFVMSEAAGLVQGLFGEYGRSQRRVVERRREFGS